jgi:hypothetical protein
VVNVKPNVWFKADFPNDTVYDENGDEVHFAGQAVARAVAELLRARGYRVDEPESESFKGWSLIAYRERRRFWMLVTLIDDYILQSEDWTRRFWPKPAEFAAFLADLEAALTSDPRFSNLRWWVKDWPPTEAETFPHPLN